MASARSFVSHCATNREPAASKGSSKAKAFNALRVPEAGTGIEPVIKDLQSSALPLGHPAKGAREAYRFASTLLNG